jgi:hypothetical protein
MASGRADLPFPITLQPGTYLEVKEIPQGERTKANSPKWRIVVIPPREETKK